MENLFDDILKNMLKDAVVIEPRELVPFRRREGLFQKCIEKYVQLVAKQNGKKEETLEVSCSYITSDEEKLFNDVLFNLFFDSEYVYKTELYITIDDFSKLIGMSDKKIYDILIGYTMIQIDIKEKEESGFISVSSLFPGSESGNCFNLETGEFDSEERYFKLQINADFLKACSEIKAEIH